MSASTDNRGFGASGALPFGAAILGAALIAGAIAASLLQQNWWAAGLLGAAGLASWRFAAGAEAFTPTAVLFDALALAIFAFMRSDYPALWQLSGPWNDVPHFNIPGASIAYTLYISGSLAALLSARRPLRAVEAIGLICIPFAFNLLITMGADWHMGEIGSFLTPGFNIPFPYKVVIGRAVVLFGVGELFLEVLAVIGAARLETNLRLHVILLVAAALGAATPMLANTAQWAVDPLAAVVVGSALAAAAQACLWSLVYIVTGLALDMMGGRPPSLTTAWGHWRAGFVKGAIYGGVFMAIILAAAALLKAPGALPFIKSQGLATGLIAGAALWPLGQTIVGSADGTPPFFGRLAGAYRDVKTYVRGAIIGIGVAWALSTDLAASDGGTRFLIAFALGAVAFAGVELLFDALRIARGERTKVQTWRLYALQALLGGLVGGALGWYFDVSQLQVVVNKFWAYADANYRASGRALGDFTTYPLFNKYGSINLGEVAGGVRLFWAESLSGVINWSIAAPLFSINYVLLSALLTRSLSPIVGLFTALGLEGLAEQAVRVMRWGLWMAPVINSFLRQSPDPTWYDQDGAVRTLVASAWDLGLPGADFRANSLMIFTGLLAYDWLRVLIWFDHMGLRVATLVNLTFLGGDRADEAAARFLGYGGRTRAIPDGIRRFATWTPLLIPFFIPRGAEWDKAWTGGEQLAKSAAALPGPIHTMAIAYSIAGAFIALGAAAVIVLSRRSRAAAGPTLAGAPATLGDFPQEFQLDNGAVGAFVMRDGRGAVTVSGAERGAGPIDITRRPLDPLQSRGQYFYICEEGEAPWSIGFEPCRRAGDYSIERTSAGAVVVSNTLNGIRASVEIAPDRRGAVLAYRTRLENLSGKPRRLKLVSFVEIAGHETGAYSRDLDFAGMHVETFFVRKLNAIFARNRLLRSPRADRGETSFFAVKPGAGAVLTGYEDSRTRFIGEGSLARPTGCEARRWRQMDDEGRLWTFDPAASFTLSAAMDANGSVEAEFIVGRADNAVWAADLVAKRLGLEPLPELQLQTWLYETRAVEPSPAMPSRWPFEFTDDGRKLRLTHRTPRPWSHVLANELGAAVCVSNDGEIYSAFANARHNGLTPFRFESTPTQLPGQIVYVRNLDTGETDAPGYAPFQRDDVDVEVTYEPGVARFAKRRGDLTMVHTIFVPPDFPGDMRLITLKNSGVKPMRLRVAPFFDMALDEGSNESLGKLRIDRSGDVLLFENPQNDMERGTAFVATSLAGARTEQIRTRFFGGPERDIRTPVMLETGAPDASRSDDRRRIAAFVADLELAPGGETKIAVVLGMTRSRKDSLAAAASATVAIAEAKLEATRNHWREFLGRVEIRTNRPDFDRLVNTWLPYQVVASRLFGRVGPNQRGGATGYRDQLQDVLPLILIEPRLTRAQIVLHSAQQFLEGDVLKWWHRGPYGATGLGQRTKACDPHLWLPYVTTRYVEQTGDKSVLDEITPFLEGPAVPAHEDTWIVTARPSRETATVYRHCLRAIEYTLNHLGANGMPLLGAGDWNDGIDVLGRRGKGTSVWMSFFFYDVLVRFAAMARAYGDVATAERCETAAKAQSKASEVGWRGDHYALDFADDGTPLALPNAMTTGWAAHSGAVDDVRALAALEGGLKIIERPDRILLTSEPFYEHSKPYPGRIADYPPGVRENGGQYSHGASWIIDGFLRLSRNARDRGEADKARALSARAFEIFVKISPLGKTEGEALSLYGLIPIQQPADIYDGHGHGGRGGWSWYTGSAARMLSAAYEMAGVEMTPAGAVLGADAFAAKGELKVVSVRVGAKVWGG